MNTMLAHAKELHSSETSQLEHLLSEPVSGSLIFVGGVLSIVLVSRVLGRGYLITPGVSLFSLLLTVMTADSFQVLAIITATTAAVAALHSIYQLLAP